MASEDSDDSPRTNRFYRWFDDRFDLDDGRLGKAFPEDQYGSFLLGEVALFSFVILAGTGSYLGLLYAPVATKKWEYTGQVLKYSGRTLPGAFASVLRITYDIRLGMYVRMMHHWAAYFFIAAISLHMFRVFFSGVYRNPREPNWLIGSTLLLLALVEGFFGYALPYDNFSKTAVSIGFELTNSIPLVGHRITNLVFGGNFPANAPYVLPRLFFYHVFVLPATMAVLIGLHLSILVRQQHTEQANYRRQTPNAPESGNQNVVMGIPLYPNQIALSAIVFLFTASVISFLAALFPVQRVALIGPATPFQTPTHVAPDWFFMWAYGALKLIGNVLGEFGRFIGGVLIPSLLVAAMYVWPFVDRSEEPIHVAENPLNRPGPTAVGVTAIALVIMLSIAGMNTFVADLLGTTVGALTIPLLVLTLVVPLLEGTVVYVVLRKRLQRKDRGE